MGKDFSALLRKTREIEGAYSVSIQPAACAMSPAAVTTPVPPIPTRRISVGLERGVSETGSGSFAMAASRLKSRAAGTGLFAGVAPSSVTKLGQKPLRHEKSVLQAD